MVRRASKGFPKKDKRKGVKREVHSVPDQIDIDIKHQEYIKFSKTLDENGRPKPLTENQLKQIIRGAVRKKWMFANSKLAFLESKREPDLDPNNRRIWKWKCNHCGEYFGGNEINVDHISQEESFTELDAAFTWASSILNAGGDDDLQILCIPDHEIKSHADKYGFTWEAAILDKKAISWEEDKTSNHQEFLMSKGFSKEETSNIKKRRACYIKYLNSLDNT
jgi:hypothetical protein